MSTFLFPSPVFGPVHSRRLGLSLGINLLPADGKLCSFDCIYCECGLNEAHRPKTPMTSRELVAEKLEERLKALAAQGKHIDAITFAGNGEPTLHPDFPGIIDDATRLRDVFAPSAKICVLTNAVSILKPEFAAALMRSDLPMLKLDSVDPEWIRKVNRPQTPYNVEKMTEAMRAQGKKVVIQTMFVKGTYDGIDVDNSDDAHVLPWIDALKRIAPGRVEIYTIDRDAPCRTLEPVPYERLCEIGETAQAAGLTVHVSKNTQANASKQRESEGRGEDRLDL